MKNSVLFATIILAVVVAFVVVISLNLDLSGTTPTPIITPVPYAPQTVQLQIRVTFNGAWIGTYADTPISAPASVDIAGTGNRTITIDRPSDSILQWVISVVAEKQIINNDVLTVSILKMDGTVLTSANTNTNEPVSVMAIVED